MRRVLGSIMMVMLVASVTGAEDWRGRPDIEAAERYLESAEGQRALRETEREMDAMADREVDRAGQTYGTGSSEHRMKKAELCAKGYTQHCD